MSVLYHSTKCFCQAPMMKLGTQIDLKSMRDPPKCMRDPLKKGRKCGKMMRDTAFRKHLSLYIELID